MPLTHARQANCAIAVNRGQRGHDAYGDHLFDMASIKS